MNQTIGSLHGKHFTLPAKGPHTIHQSALLWFWITSLVLYGYRLCSKFFRLTNGHQCIGDVEMKQVVVEDSQKEDDKKEICVDNLQSNKDPAPAKLNTTSEPTLDKFLESVSILGAIMFFFYLCDYKHLFPAAARVYSRDLFIFLCLILVLVGAFFTTRDCPDKLLGREQTEEWKGIMQVLFVWYHYFKAVETYNAIRVFIAAYVWMTGFGNFSFFWLRKDFSLYRIMKMMFRLNFLVFITCLVTVNEYMLYYICAMHTFWFISVYFCMRPLYKRNVDPKFMAVKFAMFVGIVFLLFDVPSVGKFAFSPFGFILSYKNSLHEWMFRAGLDHYATVIGMIIAYFHPNFESLLLHMESPKLDRKLRYIYVSLKILLAVCFVMILFTWWRHIFLLDKYQYNALHPYFSFIPLLTYIYLRNLFPTLRSRFIYMFSWLGKITLETYIAQLHILMQGNAKYLIVYIPGYPLLNFTLATTIYLFMSYQLFHVTVDISAYLITKDLKAMGRKLVIGVLWMGGCYVYGAFCM